MRFTFLFLIFFPSLVTHAQERGDSLLMQSKAKSDSILRVAQNKQDSLQEKFTKSADSLKALYQKPITYLNKKENDLNKIQDSLMIIGQRPNEKIQQQLDSIRIKKEKLINQFNHQKDSVVNRYQKKLAKLNKVPGIKSKVNLPGNAKNINVENNNLPNSNFDLPEISGLDLNQTNEMSSIDNKLPDVNNPIPNTNLNNPLQKIETPKELGMAKDVKSKIETFKNDTTSIDQKASKVAEDKIAKEVGLDGFSDQQQKLNDQLKPQSEEEAKAALLEQAQTTAINHFQGKEALLQEAMEKMAKYKKKYNSLASIKDAKKFYNPLKEKSFRERIFPGISFQYQKSNDYMLDINPSLGYMILQNVSAGVGFNYRLIRSDNNESWRPKQSIYGPRAFAEVKLFKGFLGYIEYEYMNTRVPEKAGVSRENGKREWVSGLFTGIKTRYPITRWMKGTAIVQFNWLNDGIKSPYGNNITSRIGFEFYLKKKAK
ncbi:MAG: hypothetical protein O9340_02600 [Cyclobacteriaceae bacterium]|nr:hypothetical protein [Cyclobacteriaceae bacterium]